MDMGIPSLDMRIPNLELIESSIFVQKSRFCFKCKGFETFGYVDLVRTVILPRTKTDASSRARFWSRFVNKWFPRGGPEALAALLRTPAALLRTPPLRKYNFWGPGEDNRRGRDKTNDLTRLMTPKGSADKAI